MKYFSSRRREFDGLLLAPFQALLTPLGLWLTFLVFGYFCLFQMPFVRREGNVTANLHELQRF